MSWIQDKFKFIILCVGIGLLLRIINDYAEVPWSHAFQGCLILSFVIMGFWQQKSVAIILSILTAFLLFLIEYYSLPQWNNLFRGSLILTLLVYLVIWSKIIRSNVHSDINS